MAILMIPCYCYTCGPMSGPYWAWQRDGPVVYDSGPPLKPQSQCARPPQMVICNNRATGCNYGGGNVVNGGPRMRSAVNVNGYGRM